MCAWADADKAAARDWVQENSPQSKSDYYKGIVEFCKMSEPSDRVCLDSKMDDKLYGIWKDRSVIPEDVPYSEGYTGKYGIPSDIIFANTVPLKDCEICVDERDQLKDGIICKFRVVIFEPLDFALKLVKKFEEEGVYEKQSPFLIGALIIELPQGRLYIPIYVQYGVNFCLVGNAFLKGNNGEYHPAESHNGDWGAIGNQFMLTWYSIQISLLHPTIKTLYHVNDPSIRNAKKKKSKQTKRRTKLIRRMYLDEAEYERETTGSTINRKTLVWYVCGHFRHYKNGRVIFIQPYWKGVLREVKRNLDRGRDRAIAV